MRRLCTFLVLCLSMTGAAVAWGSSSTSGRGTNRANAAMMINATAGNAVLLGNQTVQATQDGGQSTSEAFGYTASVSGTATSISVYLDSTGGVLLGLYTDKSSKPGVRMDEGSVASNAAGWVTVPLSGGAKIASGTRYWIAIAATSSSRTAGYRDAGNSGSMLDYSGNGLANPYSINQQWSSNPASVYVRGTTSTPVAPANTVLPATSGTAQQGDVLTASTGTWTGTAPIIYTYQWQRGGITSIANATSSNYTASAGDVGHTLDVLVTATNAGGSTSAESVATAVVAAPLPPTPPSNTALPTISGKATQGQIVSTTNGSWTGSPTSYSYQWQDCGSSGNSCTSASGATSSSYMLTSGDVGHTMRVLVAASNTGGSTPAKSAQTAAVASSGGGSVAFDANLGSTHASSVSSSLVLTTSAAASSGTRVVILVSYWAPSTRTTGVAVGGAAATMDERTINPDGADVFEVWSIPQSSGLTSGSLIVASFNGGTGGVLLGAMSIAGVEMTNGGGVAGTGSSNNQIGTSWTSGTANAAGGIVVGGAGNEAATSTTATVSTGTKVHDAWDSGSQQGFVTAHNTGGSSVSGTFSTSTTVAVGGAVAYSSASGGGPAPSNTALPVASGTAQQGKTLTTTDGTWTGPTPMSYTYTWQDCSSSGGSCVNISGATASSYTLAVSDVGSTVRSVVKATNTTGNASASSAATAAITGPLAAPANTARPAITGSATVGSTLTGTNGAWTGNPTPTYAYQWQHDGTTTIAGATTSAYVVASGDVGHQLDVVVTATNSNGSAFAASAGTAAVTIGGTLPHDPAFVGPSYYTKFANGPSTSTSYFPIGTYEMDITNSVNASRMNGMGINFIDQEYSGGCIAELDASFANGTREQVNPEGSGCPAGASGTFSNPLGDFAGDTHTGSVFGYALFDEPNGGTGPYSMQTCTTLGTAPIVSNPSQDTCAVAAINDENTLHTADPTRTIWGNFTKDVFPWNEYPASSWSTANCGSGTLAAQTGHAGSVTWSGCFEKHNSMVVSGLDLMSADIYPWADPYEASNTNMDSGCNNNSGHCGAWVDGFAVDRIKALRPGTPPWMFLGMTRSTDSQDVETPRMLNADVWDTIAHGARGIVWWTADFAPGVPATPYTGSNCSIYWDALCDHFWDNNYNQAATDDATIKADAVQLNSPTVTGVSATASDSTPMAVLGKDVNGSGKLWLLVMADGNATHPMSNTSPMTATTTVPSAIPPGTVLNVVGESRTVTVNSSHQFTDTFGSVSDTNSNGLQCGCTVSYGYQHHIYAMP
jgi:hypothetical protein